MAKYSYAELDSADMLPVYVFGSESARDAACDASNGSLKRATAVRASALIRRVMNAIGCTDEPINIDKRTDRYLTAAGMAAAF